ncbi:hypothetical protein ACFS07_32410 [Undibacterium arcticum]
MFGAETPISAKPLGYTCLVVTINASRAILVDGVVDQYPFRIVVGRLRFLPNRAALSDQTRPKYKIPALHPLRE